MDEYQLQVPDQLVRWKKYETGFDNKVFVETILADVSKSKKNKAKGKPYKSAKEMCEEYKIDMDQLKKVIGAQALAESTDGGKFILSGNTKVLEDGTVGIAYSRAGELMVQCIEDAYKELNCPVHITGEYLMATSEEGWAGAH